MMASIVILESVLLKDLQFLSLHNQNWSVSFYAIQYHKYMGANRWKMSTHPRIFSLGSHRQDKTYESLQNLNFKKAVKSTVFSMKIIVQLFWQSNFCKHLKCFQNRLPLNFSIKMEHPFSNTY